MEWIVGWGETSLSQKRSIQHTCYTCFIGHFENFGGALTKGIVGRILEIRTSNVFFCYFCILLI